MVNNNNDFIPITLPPNLTLMVKREWRKKKTAELQARQEQEAAAQTQTENVSESVSDENPPQAEYSAVTVNEASTVDISANQPQKTDMQLDAVYKKSISRKSKPTKKQAKSAVKSSSDELELCHVRGIPKSVIYALKHVFPQAKNHADLLSASAYIFTNGDCEISPGAMELVTVFQRVNIL